MRYILYILAAFTVAVSIYNFSQGSTVPGVVSALAFLGWTYLASRSRKVVRR